MTEPPQPAPDALPPPPQPPAPGDCCGGGCARCVHDVYLDELERWQRAVAEIEQARAGDAAHRPPS